MNALELSNIGTHIYQFIDILCNYYTRYSKENMKIVNGQDICFKSLGTLYYILTQTNILLAPFMPHLVDYFSLQLDKSHLSNHLKSIDFQIICGTEIDMNIIEKYYSVNSLIKSVLTLRTQIQKNLKYPLYYIEIYVKDTSHKIFKECEGLICRELKIIYY